MDRVLPKIGEEVIERKQTVSREIVTYEKKITDQQIVDDRMENRHALSVFFTWGGMAYDPAELGISRGGGGPSIGFILAYDLNIIRPLGLALKTGMMFNTEFGSDSGPQIQVPAYVGPSLTFSGRRTDLTIGVDGHFRYLSSFSYFDSDFGGDLESPALFLFGASLDTGLKVYLNQRMSTTPVFINIGLIFDLYARVFLSDFSLSTSVPLSTYLVIGGGVRL
jgi:hypothetical protein